MAVIAVVVALLLPAIQAAREAARRSQCTNNLKQLCLASQNYHETVGCFPQGVQFSFSFSTASHFVALLPYMESTPLFDAVNFEWNIWSTANTTVHGVALGALSCPSDYLASNAENFPANLAFAPGYSFLYYGVFPQHYTSYAGNAGTWYLHARDASVLACSNGMFFRSSCVRIADVTDGASNTICHGEHAVSILTDIVERINGPNWAGSWYGSTTTASLYPINPTRRINDVSADGLTTAYVGAMSSMHPGGVNVGMVDGSVRFLKETVDSWCNDPVTGIPLGWTRGTDGQYHPGPGARMGVFQFLTTRRGNEIIPGSW
jgi:prepilin-type processing-associated H-X9-DG protein